MSTQVESTPPQNPSSFMTSGARQDTSNVTFTYDVILKFYFILTKKHSKSWPGFVKACKSAPVPAEVTWIHQPIDFGLSSPTLVRVTMLIMKETVSVSFIFNHLFFHLSKQTRLFGSLSYSLSMSLWNVLNLGIKFLFLQEQHVWKHLRCETSWHLIGPAAALISSYGSKRTVVLFLQQISI